MVLCCRHTTCEALNTCCTQRWDIQGHKTRVNAGTCVPEAGPAGAAEPAASVRELEAEAPLAAAEEAPKPRGADVAAAEPKLKPAAVEVEGKGVLTASGKALELAGVEALEAGKLKGRAEAAADVLVAGVELSPKAGAAQQPS